MFGFGRASILHPATFAYGVALEAFIGARYADRVESKFCGVGKNKDVFVGFEGPIFEVEEVSALYFIPNPRVLEVLNIGVNEGSRKGLAAEKNRCAVWFE